VVQKIVKIGPEKPEIIGLEVFIKNVKKRKRINASKTYSPFERYAKRAK